MTTDPMAARRKMQQWASTSSIDKLNDLGGLSQQEFLEHRQRKQEDSPLNISCMNVVRQLQTKGDFEDAFLSLEAAVDAEKGRREKALACMLLAEHINRWCAASTSYNRNLMAIASQYADRALQLFQGTDPLSEVQEESLDDRQDIEYKRVACYWKALNFATLASLGGHEDVDGKDAMEQAESALECMQTIYTMEKTGSAGSVPSPDQFMRVPSITITEGRELFVEGIIFHCKAQSTANGKYQYGDVRDLRESALECFRKAYETYNATIGDDRNVSVKAMTMISVENKLLGNMEEAHEWLKKETQTRARIFGRANTRTQLAFKQLDEMQLKLGMKCGNSAITEEEMNLSCSAIKEEMIRWDLDPFDQPDQWLMESMMWEFRQLALTSEFKIADSNLSEFLLGVRQGYHDNPFHNFKHAWSVAHCAYLIMKETKAGRILTKLEQLCVMITCLCHDLDHPGVNSDFLIKSASPLALEFTVPSVLEHMHFRRTEELLRESYSTNILQNCNEATRKLAFELIYDGIMATDMQNHKTIVAELDRRAELIESNSEAFDANSSEDRRHLLKGIIHAADLSAQGLVTKIAHKFGARVLAEFHNQSVQEERENLPMTAFMKDLDKSLTQAKAQLGFLHYVVAPLWRNMSRVFPELQHMYDNIDDRVREIDFEDLASWEGKNSEILSKEP